MITPDPPIKWRPVDDGWGIVGYGWKCPGCGNEEMFGHYWEEEIDCEKCYKTFKNEERPDE